MKGSLPTYIGLLVIIIVTVTFIYNGYINLDKSARIAAASTKMYVVENSAEATKRSLDAAVDFSARRTIYELGKQQEWKNDGPKINDLKKEFSEKIHGALDSLPPQFINKYALEWKPSKIFVKTENKIEVSGSKPFVIKTSGANIMTFSSAGKFSEKFDSKFFDMAIAGRELFDDGEWIVSEEALNAGGEECKEKVSGAKTDGFFKVKISELLKTSLQCGYRSIAGLASIQHHDKNKAEEIVKKISAEMAADLSTKNKLQIRLNSEISETKTESGYNVNVRTNFNSINENFLTAGESSFESEKLDFYVLQDFKIPE